MGKLLQKSDTRSESLTRNNSQSVASEIIFIGSALECVGSCQVEDKDFAMSCPLE